MSALVLVIAGCAFAPHQACPSPSMRYAKVLISDVPHVQQEPDFCGEACAQMWLAKLGTKWTQDEIFNAAGIEPVLGRGCYTRELNDALTKIGLTTGDVWYRFNVVRKAEKVEGQFKALHADLGAGVPSIVCMYYDGSPRASEHFRLVLGYDPGADEVIYHEPAIADGEYKHMQRDEFLKLWPLQSSPFNATIIRLRLAGINIEDPPAARGFTPADFAQCVMQIKQKVSTEFTIVVQPPFVVVGDQHPREVHRRATETVKWAIDRLKRDFFSHDPDHILSIWLFKSDDSYRKHAQKLFGHVPQTPYGYYSEANKALVMNISTGGGTLVHEIVHPYMRANFPECPPWFNEGLGSLYEQAGDRGGHIVGLTNWRLAGLQEAIKAGMMPSLQTLTSMNERQFYHEDLGTNYAQSRYLCYYLQEKGLLTKFYREFVANTTQDSTGYNTLVRILDESDMDAFNRKWEAYVLGLRFP